ncbi:YkgJ family cysteine cluster protein [Pendulispora brunnea]|uniref:YkgJ family cysteine cluster protein n=1 Tax=Pendulispora brunnea TaxID=2905690 RepID=A0ABZ2JUA1_9BACT
MKNIPGARYLNFRCTGCGNCCKDPLLPLTQDDILRIIERTGDSPGHIAQVVDKHAIHMDDEPEAFAMLRQGKRVLVLRHEKGRCIYLGDDNRCTIYTSRPLGCRIYPLDPDFNKEKKLRRLTLVKATECPYEMDGSVDVEPLYDLQQRYWKQHEDYNTKVAEWNRVQRRRRREGRAAQTAREFFTFLGLPDSEPSNERRVPKTTKSAGSSAATASVGPANTRKAKGPAKTRATKSRTVAKQKRRTSR